MEHGGPPRSRVYSEEYHQRGGITESAKPAGGRGTRDETRAPSDRYGTLGPSTYGPRAPDLQSLRDVTAKELLRADRRRHGHDQGAEHLCSAC